MFACTIAAGYEISPPTPAQPDVFHDERSEFVLMLAPTGALVKPAMTIAFYRKDCTKRNQHQCAASYTLADRISNLACRTANDVR